VPLSQATFIDCNKLQSFLLRTSVALRAAAFPLCSGKDPFMIARTNDVALLAARLSVAALFLPAGIGKLFNLPVRRLARQQGRAVSDLLATLRVAAEIVGPVALSWGCSPPHGAAAHRVHGDRDPDQPRFWTFPAEAQSTQQIQFFKNVAIIAGLLFYLVSGPGAIASRCGFSNAGALLGTRSAGSPPRLTLEPRSSPRSEAVSCGTAPQASAQRSNECPAVMPPLCAIRRAGNLQDVPWTQQ
jgi:putative oxidoreductase